MGTLRGRRHRNYWNGSGFTICGREGHDSILRFKKFTFVAKRKTVVNIDSADDRFDNVREHCRFIEPPIISGWIWLSYGTITLRILHDIRIHLRHSSDDFV
ncbi:hypothetical protein GYMLUDRAFT_50279, partial [Collybiopsis luxurians FD-317 M1]